MKSPKAQQKNYSSGSERNHLVWQGRQKGKLVVARPCYAGRYLHYQGCPFPVPAMALGQMHRPANMYMVFKPVQSFELHQRAGWFYFSSRRNTFFAGMGLMKA